MNRNLRHLSSKRNQRISRYGRPLVMALLALGGFYADLVRRQQLEQEIEGGEDAA